MIIRKLFKFENAHIVRGCSTQRCRTSIHGHSYKVEVLLESNYLDDGQMIYDFGLMKTNIKDLIDSFDHAITLWDKDDIDYIEDIKKHSDRWVVTPISPSAEQFSRIFFLMIDKLLSLTKMVNNEKEVHLQSIIVHETETGYAKCFKNDAHSKLMGEINLSNIFFSKPIQEDWKDSQLWYKILHDEQLVNSKTV